MHNDQLVAVNQGGKRAGSGCAYLEVWHNDIREFLELRRNTGDERRRTHDMNTACWIPDLFMQRVEARGQLDAVPLQRRAGPARDLRRDVRGALRGYEQRAAAGELYGETMPALELWKQMLKMLFETGHPWLTFKDPCNVRSPQDHAGVIHSSQPLHRDHAQHRAATRPRSATSARSCSTSTSRADGELDHAQAARDDPRSPSARSTT